MCSTRRMFAPTANIAGFTSGYGGPGSKTIVPSTAVVKMDFRLVPNQTPETMLALLRAHLDRRGFTDVEVVQLGGHRPGKTPVDHPFVQAGGGRLGGAAARRRGRPADDRRQRPLRADRQRPGHPHGAWSAAPATPARRSTRPTRTSAWPTTTPACATGAACSPG